MKLTTQAFTYVNDFLKLVVNRSFTFVLFDLDIVCDWHILDVLSVHAAVNGDNVDTDTDGFYRWRTIWLCGALLSLLSAWRAWTRRWSTCTRTAASSTSPTTSLTPMTSPVHWCLLFAQHLYFDGHQLMSNYVGKYNYECVHTVVSRSRICGWIWKVPSG